jgi:GNAT superfamily N-acetyltransferase
MTIELSIKPISQDLWTDFEELFGLNGACGGCWCMYWKLRCKAYDESRGSAARQMHKSIVDAGTVTGLLAYAREEVVGWVAVEPRREYEKLAHSHILKPVDDQPVWSVSCFYVAKGYRRQGVTVSLLKAAVRHVKRMGGRIVRAIQWMLKRICRLLLCLRAWRLPSKKRGLWKWRATRRHVPFIILIYRVSPNFQIEIMTSIYGYRHKIYRFMKLAIK